MQYTPPMGMVSVAAHGPAMMQGAAAMAMQTPKKRAVAADWGSQPATPPRALRPTAESASPTAALRLLSELASPHSKQSSPLDDEAHEKVEKKKKRKKKG